MASLILKKPTTTRTTTILKHLAPLVKSPFYPCKHYSTSAAARDNRRAKWEEKEQQHDEVEMPSEGISRPMSEILKQLNKRVPDSLIKARTEENGFSTSYIPWLYVFQTHGHIVNRIMNLHAPEWTGEVRSITYSPDGKFVSVVYRVTLHGTDAEISRDSTGTASVEEKGFGDPVQKAESMAFRRACARLGLGLHMYHEDML